MSGAITIALLDDHVLLRGALAGMINGFGTCRVVFEGGDGTEVVHHFKNGGVADIVILDMNMPGMNGLDTALWLKQHQPGVRMLLLTMYDSELMMVKLVQAGVTGFLKKDVPPSELKFAINAMKESGYYYSSHTAHKLANLFTENGDRIRHHDVVLTDGEMEFLKLACTDMTYKEIAISLHLSPRTVDLVRDALFMKLDVRSRVGLAMVALRNGVVTY